MFERKRLKTYHIQNNLCPKCKLNEYCWCKWSGNDEYKLNNCAILNKVQSIYESNREELELQIKMAKMIRRKNV